MLTLSSACAAASSRCDHSRTQRARGFWRARLVSRTQRCIAFAAWLTAARVCSAEQRLSIAQSNFVAYDFQRTVGGYFGIDPLLVVIVSVVPVEVSVIIVRYVVYFPTLILAQNFYNSA